MKKKKSRNATQSWNIRWRHKFPKLQFFTSKMNNNLYSDYLTGLARGSNKIMCVGKHDMGVRCYYPFNLPGLIIEKIFQRQIGSSFQSLSCLLRHDSHDN